MLINVLVENNVFLEVLLNDKEVIVNLPICFIGYTIKIPKEIGQRDMVKSWGSL